MTLEQEQKLNEVYEFMQNMKNAETIPYEVDVAIRDRFKEAFQTFEVLTSNKAANSEDITINEAGSATKLVLNNPDAFFRVRITDADGTVTTYWVPGYDS